MPIFFLSQMYEREYNTDFTLRYTDLIIKDKWLAFIK